MAPRVSVGRVVLAVLVGGVLLVAGALVLEMSGSAPRTAGSDRVRPLQFSAILPGGGTVCQPVEPIPYDAARASVLVGTYGRPLPPVTLRFRGAGGSVVAEAAVPGGRQGYVDLPLRWVSHGSAATACLHIGGRFQVAVGGNVAPRGPGAAVVDGKRQPADITIFYLRRGSETWWQLLPVLDLRFGLGKAAFFGRWTLPVVALLVLLLWVGSIRLLARELR